MGQPCPSRFCFISQQREPFLLPNVQHNVSFTDILRQVFESIWSHRLRSFLTMFGIAWGVASLLLLVGLGEGFRSGQTRSLKQIGTDVIMEFGGTIPALANQHQGFVPYKVTMRDAADIATLPHVRSVTAISNRSDLKEVSEFSSAAGQVLGIQTNFPQIRNLPLAEGRGMDDADETERHRVVVLGKKINEILFPQGQTSGSLGKYITINGSRFQVIGVAQAIGRGNNEGDNRKLYVPLTSMLELFPPQGENLPTDAISVINFQPITIDLSDTAKAEVHQVLGRNHGFDGRDHTAFDEWDTIKSSRMVGVIFTGMDLFLGGVGIVTLALGAVGIINIMLVTVSERTKEIGLRKALGATNRSIMLQFFFEGLTLTSVSGIIGIVGAALLMLVMGAVAGTNMQGFDPPRLVPWSAAMAFFSLSLCGIVAGLYPASRAARLEPVEALRKD